MRCKRFRVVLLSGISLVTSSCSKEQETAPPPATIEQPQTAAPGAAPTSGSPRAQANGTIVGKVIFKGTPATAKLSIGKDKEVCGDSKTDPSLLVGAQGELRNVVVQIASLRSEESSASKNIELDQKNCEYTPHVLAVPAGATVKIKNSDGILHNVHTVSKANTPFNRAQPKFLKEIAETFAKPEIVALRCDVHGWMSGWIVVTDSAFHAVSGADGRFTLTDVPPGKHTLELWHELLGKQSLSVEVKAGETSNVSYEFSATR